MVEREFEDKKENSLAAQNAQDNGWSLGLTGIGGNKWPGNVAQHQRARGNCSHEQEDPGDDPKRNNANDDRRHERNQGISIDTNPFDQLQGLHTHAPCCHPKNCRQHKGIRAQNRARAQQMIDIVVELRDIIRVKIVVHVGSDLLGGA